MKTSQKTQNTPNQRSIIKADLLREANHKLQLSEDTGIVTQVLVAVGINLEMAQLEVEKIIGYGKETPTDIPFTPKAKKALEFALEAARQLYHDYIGTEHLLLSILRTQDSLGARVLQIFRIELILLI